MRTEGNFHIRYVDRNTMQIERTRIFRLVEEVLPFASVMEVGSTAAEGVVGKQDLDFALRVPPGRFYEAQSILDSHFDRNERQRPVVGHQCYLVYSQLDVSLHLVVLGGSCDNDFERFLQILLKKKELRIAYNNLKFAWNGRPMSGYRRAKKIFIESALSKGSHENSKTRFSIGEK